MLATSSLSPLSLCPEGNSQLVAGPILDTYRNRPLGPVYQRNHIKTDENSDINVCLLSMENFQRLV